MTNVKNPRSAPKKLEIIRGKEMFCSVSVSLPSNQRRENYVGLYGEEGNWETFPVFSTNLFLLH